MLLDKYSMGVGDRFAQQGNAQLKAMLMAKEQGVLVAPVWNKSHREHTTIKTSPEDVRLEADKAVADLGWDGPYFVDADHINRKNVDGFIESSNFFTLDVAEAIGKKAENEDVRTFVHRFDGLAGDLKIPGIDGVFQVAHHEIEDIAGRYLMAVKQAGALYRYLADKKGAENFVTEVSMDETEKPQTPLDLLVILAALSAEGIPAQTIAPRFSGRFNKGVDYVGDVDQFAREFEQDVCVIRFATEQFGLPENLKLSVHSGSDKFSIYDPIRRILKEYDVGLHLKTAGTTWLEELIGLALAEWDGLDIARKVYRRALGRYEELAAPYAQVIEIDRAQLPSADEVDTWSGQEYADALRHDQDCERYNPNFRQLLHVGYKVAAEMGETYISTLQRFEDVVAENVTTNIYERHLKRLFI